ncbi:hypothetical protein AMAG_19101 [Allomyces macrogynus ATCC 38327]|uniref:Cholesterol side-chain cleavage enzyme, mitochondrial n=1 Tax=Allomyces macrogynus (strain ATCC 38327) TaxID=578462 RepID=A0A0L0SNE2_ALLM3|nr:hypothetical protein AMAG_19101 [Allomyces macrogynus ATCC 38327]|eukprot:KNE64036.1 hypothetical protein AMAG_19101 [Allomyces macrogynus ATCC 38327]
MGPIFNLPEFIWRYQLTSSACEHFKALQTMDLTNEVMSTTLSKRTKDSAQLHGTFLGHVLQRDATLTRDEMPSTAIDLLFAGVDTTSWSLLNIMNLLSRHLDAQTKLRNEFMAVVGADPNATLDATHHAKLEYLKNFIKEAMRFNTVISTNSRILPRDTYYADPELSNSDRWDAKDIHPFASLPFGFGPRMCVGRRIAEMEMTVFLAHLLRRFEIMPPPPPTDLVFNFFIVNEKPIPLKFRPLSNLTAAAAVWIVVPLAISCRC